MTTTTTEMTNLRAWVQEWRDEAATQRERFFEEDAGNPGGYSHRAAFEAAKIDAFEHVLHMIDQPIEHTPR